MSVKAHKATTQRLADAMNAHDTATFDVIATPMVAHELKDAMQWLDGLFAGHHIDVTDMIAEGDQVVARVTMRGGHSGEWEGVAATGKQWANTGVLFLRFSDGKIAAFEGLFDDLSHLKQLGATITLPESAHS
jgi:ketosteroid isomerase-like protein